MEELEKKLKELKELLEKGMNNAGLGGPGSVKSGLVLPSISKLPKPGNNSLAGKVKIPNATPATKKSPIKSAEQTQNKDIKDLKMKEAQAQLKVAPMKKEDVADSSLYHIHQGGQRITSSPVSLRDINDRHGGVKKLESAGYRLVEHKPEAVTIKKNGQWELDKADGEAQRPHYDYKPDKGLSSHIRDAKMHVKNGDIKSARSSLKWAKEAAEKLPQKREMPKDIPENNIPKKQEQEATAPHDMEKSGYKGYTDEDNARRKANNLSETTGIHTMDSIKRYGGSGPGAAAREASEMKRKSKKNPVKIYTPEEIAALNEKKS